MFLVNFDKTWTQKGAAAEGRRPLLGAAEGRDHIFYQNLLNIYSGSTF
jgi:hypothetical protein